MTWATIANEQELIFILAMYITTLYDTIQCVLLITFYVMHTYKLSVFSSLSPGQRWANTPGIGLALEQPLGQSLLLVDHITLWVSVLYEMMRRIQK